MNQPKMIISRNCALYIVHYEGSNIPLFKSLKRANCKDFIAANEKTTDGADYSYNV